MPRKDLKVVAIEPSSDAPPPKLGAAGRELWRSVMAQYELTDAGGRMLLEQACAAVDLAEEMAEQIRQDGPMVRTRDGGRKDHPCLKHLIAARALATRTLQKLHLDHEAIARPGRPSGSVY